MYASNGQPAVSEQEARGLADSMCDLLDVGNSPYDAAQLLEHEGFLQEFTSQVGSQGHRGGLLGASQVVRSSTPPLEGITIATPGPAGIPPKATSSSATGTVNIGRVRHSQRHNRRWRPRRLHLWLPRRSQEGRCILLLRTSWMLRFQERSQVAKGERKWTVT